METYEFSYRRTKGKCLHCEKQERKSMLRSFLDSFRSKKVKEAELKTCEFEWKSYKVMGHGPENFSIKDTKFHNGQREEVALESKNLEKMVLYFANGALMTVADWKYCELKLGTDWVIFTQRRMERESGQDVKLTVDTDLKVDESI
jgi:hypothetical protein